MGRGGMMRPYEGSLKEPAHRLGCHMIYSMMKPYPGNGLLDEMNEALAA